MHIKPTDLVLEVGSGDNPHPRSDVLVDRYLTTSTERAGGFGIRIDRPFVVADGNQLPFPDKTFDYVFCSHVLEHMKDPKRFIREITRVAKAGFMEVPSAVSERVFGWDFHHWYCERDGKRLILRKKGSGVRHGGFFHSLIDQTVWFRRWFEEHEALWYVNLEWKGRPAVLVENMESPSYAARLDRRADRMLEGAYADISKDMPFFFRFMARRIKRKLLRELHRFSHGLHTLLDPHSPLSRLLPYLACPVCKGPLSLRGSSLRCPDCMVSYPIKRGIAILLTPHERKKGY